MGTDKSFIDYIIEQLEHAGIISTRKMFGEYALYSDGKVVAFACDNQLFIKPTIAGRAFIGTPSEAPPYPGAKNYFLVDDGIDDRDWLSELVRVTAHELPLPKPKTLKIKKERSSPKMINQSGDLDFRIT